MPNAMRLVKDLYACINYWPEMVEWDSLTFSPSKCARVTKNVPSFKWIADYPNDRVSLWWNIDNSFCQQKKSMPIKTFTVDYNSFVLYRGLVSMSKHASTRTHTPTNSMKPFRNRFQNDRWQKPHRRSGTWAYPQINKQTHLTAQMNIKNGGFFDGV